MDTSHLPGRLGDPARTLATDDRTDRRIVAALEPLGLAGEGQPAPVGPASPIEDILAFSTPAEAGFAQLFELTTSAAPPVEGVTSETLTIPGPDGVDIPLYVTRPTDAPGPVPGIVHLHGGGMSILTATDANYRYWRESLASLGTVVVGVEFRNAAGRLGPHPFPAGLDDATTAVRWVLDNAERLGMSHVVVSGESGGGNLTLATMLRSAREGWVDRIAGAYAQCPYISGAYEQRPAELVSMAENDGYFLPMDLLGVMARTYDPDRNHSGDPLAWPLNATEDELSAMPPHVISVNELDPLRDEGLEYARKLSRAGVSVVSRMVNGTPHAGDVLFPAIIPDVYAASLRDLVGFAGSLG